MIERHMRRSSSVLDDLATLAVLQFSDYKDNPGRDQITLYQFIACREATVIREILPPPPPLNFNFKNHQHAHKVPSCPEELSDSVAIAPLLRNYK